MREFGVISTKELASQLWGYTQANKKWSAGHWLIAIFALSGHKILS